MRTFVALLLGSLMACGTSGADGEDAAAGEDARAPEPPDTSACPGGIAPPITECVGGYHHADCGGDGEPVLGCGGGHCLWFQRGCPGMGYRPIDCPLGDPFCIPTEDGAWAWVEDDYDDWPMAMADVCDALDRIGDAVVTESSGLVLDVTVDPAFVPPERSSGACEGTVGLSNCSAWDNGLLVGKRYGLDDVTILRIQAQIQLHGHTIVLELHGEEGAAMGRAFITRFTDY